MNGGGGRGGSGDGGGGGGSRGGGGGGAAVAAVGTSATAVAAVVATIVWSRRRPQCAGGGGAGRHARARRCTTPSWRLLEMGSRRRGRYYCGGKGCVLAAVMLERSRFTQRSVPRMFAESTFRYGRRVNIRGSGMAKLESIVVPSPSSQCRPPATPALTRPKAPSPAHPTAPSSSSTLSSSSPPSRPCLLPASLLTPLSYVIPPSVRPPSSLHPPPSALRPPPSALGPPPSSLILPPSSLLPPRSSPTWCHESYSLHPPRRPRPAGVRPGHEQV